MRRLTTCVVAVLLIAVPASAEAFSPGGTDNLMCINALRDLFTSDRGCVTDRDCIGDNVCVDHQCTRPRDSASTWEEFAQHEGPITGEPIPDDGGADAVCGEDRRCRIRRLAHRNRLRRHYWAGYEERIVRDETRQLLEQEEPEEIREAAPWSIGYQRHAYGHGFTGAWIYGGHIRPEATIVFQDYRGTTVGEQRLRQDVTFLTSHLTYLPSDAWLTPLLSIGFGMGSGEHSTSVVMDTNPNTDDVAPNAGSGRPDLLYHFVTGAVGAEAQFGFGLVVRLAYRYGRLIYNQVRYDAGQYDEQLREDYREFMHDEQLAGFDFTLGWAF